MAKATVVAVRGLRVAYGKVVVLDSVNLSVSAGEIVSITGINGVGKSTLLSCLAGFRKPAAGTVTVLGGPPRDNASFWRGVVLVGDQPTWYPGLTVREHLELVRMTHEVATGWNPSPEELIDFFGLSTRADASPLSLSSGQRQRLSLAAALSRPSQLLLLDEPEQSLDEGFRHDLAVLLREGYADNGGTVVMATHDNEFAVTAGSRIIQISDGHVVTGEGRPGAAETAAPPEGTTRVQAEPVSAEPFDEVLADVTEFTSGETAPAVRAVRAFIGKRRRRSWLDWYGMGFAVVFVLVYLSDILTGPLGRLSAVAGHATSHAASAAAASQAVAGTGLVVAAAAGLLALAQALGPIALSPADASWLLLSPLARGGLLRRMTASATLIALLCGALLGLLILAIAGPFLRPASPSLPTSWLALSAIAGAGLLVTGLHLAMLAQPKPRFRSWLRACWGLIAFVAAVGAVVAERSAGLSHTITSGFSGVTTATLEIVAVVAIILAVGTGILAWLALPRFPAGVLRADSAKAGRALTAAAFLNFPLLSWIAEDAYWSGRLIPSKPWPKLSPTLALAWVDWRRLLRRPALLVVLAASTVAPALVGGAITGHYGKYIIAGALLIGALAAGNQGTVTSKRDLNDRTLRRLLGVEENAALTAKAALPGLLSGAWLAIALAILVAIGVLHGWAWPAVGFIAGFGVAAAALRMARTAPINPAEQSNDQPLAAPPWAMTRALSLILGAIAAFPMLRAVGTDQLRPSTPTTQLFFSAIVLGGYLMIANVAQEAIQPASPPAGQTAGR